MIDAPDTTRGFTLIELVVTLAVAAILLTIAVPSYQQFVVNNRMATQANDLITAFNLARSEAVKRAANVAVCASSNGTSCATSDVWAQGWIVQDAAGTAMRVQPALGGASTLSGGGIHKVDFTSSGRTNMGAAATLTLCPPSPASVQGRTIEVERTGRTRVSATACP